MGRPGYSVGMNCSLFLLALLAAAPEVKYHPGHWVAFEGEATLAAFPYPDEPAIRGFSVRYRWAALEPEPGRYDFTAIRRDLAIAAKHGKQLVAFLIDKTFTSQQRSPLPADLREFGLPNEDGGIDPKKWEARLIEREVRLAEALAKEFDADPHFEGIAWQESAPGLPEERLREAGYTPERYRAALTRLLQGSSAAFARSQVFWYQNFFPECDECLPEIARALRPYRVVLSGPDILPYRRGLQTRYPIYEEFRGQMKLACAAQADSYSHHQDDRLNSEKGPYKEGRKPIHGAGYVPLEKIFEFGRDRLHLNYLFWSYITTRPKPFPGDPPAFVFEDALRVIRAHPRFNP